MLSFSAGCCSHDWYLYSAITLNSLNNDNDNDNDNNNNNDNDNSNNNNNNNL